MRPKFGSLISLSQSHRRREKTQINKIRGEIWNITKNTIEIQRIMSKYFDNLCSNKLENVDDMDKFLNACDLSN
jgi:hypothetical protein